MSRRCFLIRHARAETGPEPKILGWCDPPLREEGCCQARRLGSRFLGFKLETVWASDLRRAAETAKEVAAACGAPLRYHQGLREMDFGQWDGVHTASILDSEGFVRWTQDPLKFPPPGGEHLEHLRDRVLDSFEEILSTTSGDMALVSHGGPLRVLIAYLLGVPLEQAHRIGQDPAGVSLVLLGREPVVVFMNDTCHLQD